MSSLKKIYVLSQFSFNTIAKENELNDDNVESFKDTAFISIVVRNAGFAPRQKGRFRRCRR
ncbi:MAG: hypothetical protein LBS55_05660 [Prevotellaceae bacterium]|jgi:hypothetical protein|nr:hypothetical protein [Prevotellaceae bacterium]